MRRIVTFNWVTADGFFAAPNGNLDWVVPDEAQSAAAAARMPEFDTILFGRRTYELFEAFWRPLDTSKPTVPDPHHPGRQSADHRAIGVALNRMTKLVFSKTLKDATWENARLMKDFDPRAIDAMKRESGKDMIIFGSGSIATQLTEAGLIDEYQACVCPVFLGSGRRLLSSDASRVTLRLLESTQYPKSGDVLMRYARV